MDAVRTRAVGLGLAACLGLAGCSFASESVAGDGSSSAAAPTSTATTATAGTPATAAGTTSSRPASPTTVRGLCAQALPDRTLLGWGAATVGDFRAYRYGASNNQPLAKAFPNADDAEAGGVVRHPGREAGDHLVGRGIRPSAAARDNGGRAGRGQAPGPGVRAAGRAVTRSGQARPPV